MALSLFSPGGGCPSEELQTDTMITSGDWEEGAVGQVCFTACRWVNLSFLSVWTEDPQSLPFMHCELILLPIFFL